MNRKAFVLAGTVVGPALWSASVARGQSINAVAATGLAAPGTAATYAAIDSNYGIIATGQGGTAVAFAASTSASGPSDHAVWLDAGRGAGVQLLAADGASATNASSQLYAAGDVVLDAAGDVAFRDLGLGISAVPATGGGRITNLIGGAGTPPGTTATVGLLGQPALDAGGDLALNLYLNSPNGSAVYTTAWTNGATARGTATGVPLTPVAITGGTVPGGGTYSAVDNAPRVGGGAVFTSDTATYNVSGSTTTLPVLVASTAAGDRLVARQGDAAPGLAGQVYAGAPAYLTANAAGTLTFEARVQPAAGGASSDEVFVDGGTGPRPLFTMSQPTPVGGTFLDYIDLSTNAAGRVLFQSLVGFGSAQRGLFVAGPNGGIGTVALAGRPAPGAPAGYAFALFSNETLSDNGQAAFVATLTKSGSSSLTALYAQDPTAAGGLDLIAYVGQTAAAGPGLAAGTISGITFAPQAAVPAGDYFAGNTLAYALRFADGRTGLYEATVTAAAPAVSVAAGSAYHFAAAAPGTTTVQVRPVSGLTVAAGGQVVVDPAPAVAGRQLLLLTGTGLTLAGNAGAWTGRLDLTNNDLDVPYGSLATIASQAAEGFAGGTWAGSGGVVSSAAAADAAHTTAVGVIQNATAIGGTTPIYTTFDGQPVAVTDVLARDTYYGDTNLDGVVNAADYTRLDAGYVGRLSGWQNGDFNYDGVVDGSDYALADNAFNQQAGSVASPATATAARLGTSTATAVPEPAAAVPLAVAALLARVRRRRRRQVRPPAKSPSPDPTPGRRRGYSAAPCGCSSRPTCTTTTRAAGRPPTS